MNFRAISMTIPAVLISFCLLAQSKPFVVTGIFHGAEGKNISLINVDNNKEEDAAQIKDNHFTLQGETDKPSVFALTLKDQSIPLLIVMNGNDTLHLKTEADSFPKATVEGNKQSLSMQQYQREFLPLINKAKSINQRASTLDPNDSAAMLSLQQEADTFNQQIKSTGIAFIQYHPDAFASIFVLMNEARNIPPQQLLSLYYSLDDEVKKSSYGKMAEANIKMMAATAIGASAPAFTLKDDNGNPVSLSSFRGKYVLVDFWASWCGPCRAENPNVVKAYDTYKDQNFTILGVSLDKSKKSWLTAIHQDDLQWTQVSDLQGWNNAAAQLYHVYSIPANFLLDPSGKIIDKNLRGRALELRLAEIFDQ